MKFLTLRIRKVALHDACTFVRISIQSGGECTNIHLIFEYILVHLTHPVWNLAPNGTFREIDIKYVQNILFLVSSSYDKMGPIQFGSRRGSNERGNCIQEQDWVLYRKDQKGKEWNSLEKWKEIREDEQEELFDKIAFLFALQWNLLCPPFLLPIQHTRTLF